MKKLLIVLFAAGMVSSANAQGHQRNNKEVVYNRVDKNSYNNNIKERDQQISRISRDFDKQIQLVRKDRFMKASEKNRRISFLERQKSQQIQECVARYSRKQSDDFVRNNRRF